MCNMSNGFIRLCSMVFCWAAISACHALLFSHMTNKDDDDDDMNAFLPSLPALSFSYPFSFLSPILTLSFLADLQLMRR